MHRFLIATRWSLPFLIVAFVCTEGEPNQESNPGGDKVQVQENPNSITLSNGMISITLNKKNAQLTSLNAGSKGELLGGGGRGYYDMTAGRVDLSGPSFRLVRSEDDVAEVAFTKVIGASQMKSIMSSVRAKRAFTFSPSTVTPRAQIHRSRRKAVLCSASIPRSSPMPLRPKKNTAAFPSRRQSKPPRR